MSAPGGLSRGRHRDARREAEDADSTIPEVPRLPLSARDHSRSSEKLEPNAQLSPHTHPSLSPHPHSNSGTSLNPYANANAKRARSEAETSTIVEEDSGIPDEEYLLIREKEMQKREAAMDGLKLLGHRCVAGCGHTCWMTRV